MENKMSKAVIIGSIICSLVLLGVLSTFAYFILSPTETRNDLSVETGILSLTFSDGNPGFNKQLEFGSSAEKIFSITNGGTLEGVAKINWKNIINTYLDGSLTYSLSYSETENGNYLDIITNENVPRSETPSIIELANGLVIPPNNTYFYKLTLKLNYLDNIDQTPDLKASLTTEFSVDEGSNYLINTLLSKTNDASINDFNTGVKEEMFTFTHNNLQTEIMYNSVNYSFFAEQISKWTEEERTDYRYIGANPNNYIDFNDEIWRIIGVFTVEGDNGEKEQRIKIIREESVGYSPWNLNETNEWSTSSLSTLLNSGDYYNRVGDYTLNGLTTIAKSQIASVKWYLGGNMVNWGGVESYIAERGNTTCATTGKCEGQARNIYINQKVGLIYPSDYLYIYAYGVDDTCFFNTDNCATFLSGLPDKSWLYNSREKWTISPTAISRAYSIDILRDGRNAFRQPNESHDVNPCVYLRHNIKITGGDGSQKNPYKIK